MKHPVYRYVGFAWGMVVGTAVWILTYNAPDAAIGLFVGAVMPTIGGLIGVGMDAFYTWLRRRG